MKCRIKLLKIFLDQQVRQKNKTSKKRDKRYDLKNRDSYGYNSLIAHLLSTHKALGSIPSTAEVGVKKK
jgi:hypothetical protein